MRRSVPLFLLILFSFNCPSFGQQQKVIDSLTKVLKISKEDTSKVNLLNDLFLQYLYDNPDTALRYTQQALALAKQLEYPRGIAVCNVNIGSYYHNQSNFKSALQSYSAALKIYEDAKDSSGIRRIYNNIGLVYIKQGNYQKALEYTLKSLKVAEQIGDIKAVSRAYNTIAQIYHFRNDYQKVQEYLLKAIEIAQQANDKTLIGYYSNNLGSFYYTQDEFEKALQYFEIALQIATEQKNKEQIATGFGNIGAVYLDQKEYKKAIEYIEKAMLLEEEMGDKSGLIIANNNLGNIYSGRGYYAKALEYFERSCKIAQEAGIKEGMKDAYSKMSELCAKMKNFAKAYEYHKLYSETKDSLLNEESSKQIAEMQTKYDTEKKEQQITLLNKDKELQNAELNRQKIIIWSVAAGLLAVLILSIFIFRERKKSEKLLLNILPVETAKELKANGKATAKYYESVTVMFTDFKGFTTIAEKLSAEELVSELDFLFKKFDEIISKYPIEKIKTIGDAYMCAGGLPTANKTNAMDVVSAAIEIQNWIISQNSKWNLRIGIHTGHVTAGVVGDKKFAYDIWGDAVNTASRMESSGEPGKINISGSTYELLKNSPLEGGQGGMSFIHRGKIQAKNKGEIEMYFVNENHNNQ